MTAAGPAGARGARRLPADLGARLAVAVPGAAVLVVLIHVGGIALAAPLAVLAALGQLELARLASVGRAAAAPGALLAALGPLLALHGGRAELGGGLALGLLAALAAAAALAPPERRRAALGVTALGAVWLGAGLGHAVLLRELAHGAALVVAVLLATFLGDTAAQFAGTAFGRRRLAPAISPNKTVEGLVAGIVGGTACCAAFLALFHLGWISVGGALALGLACSLAAPAGDLFESALKRRAGVKDSGRLFGAHGGVLDRIDAAVAALVVGAYVALLVT